MSFMARHVLWVSTSGLSANTPIHDIAFWGETLLIKKRICKPHHNLESFHPILCSCPVRYLSVISASTVSWLDSITTLRFLFGFSNKVRNLVVDLDVDFSIQLVNTSISYHQTLYRMYFGSCISCVLVSRRHISLNIWQFS